MTSISNQNIPDTQSNEKYYRNIYIAVYLIVLFVSIATTVCIYYFIRHRKKYYFDAAGRKFIVASGEYENLIYKLIELLQFDNKPELEAYVKSII
jgi:hypothetical protein